MATSRAEPGIFGHGGSVAYDLCCGCCRGPNQVGAEKGLHEVEFDLRAHLKRCLGSHFWLEMGITSPSESLPPPEVEMLAMIMTRGAVEAGVGHKKTGLDAGDRQSGLQVYPSVAKNGNANRVSLPLGGLWDR